MANLGRCGHRKRMREAYMLNGIETMPDHNVLELFLSLVIPQKDVKPLAYSLINKFGSLAGVIGADFNELTAVDGIGETTAAAICLIKDINSEIKRRNRIKLDNFDSAAVYCKKLIGASGIKKLLLISLSNGSYVINSHIIALDNQPLSSLKSRDIIRLLIQDNASSVIIATNHPDENTKPTIEEYNFSITLNTMLKRMNINFFDHIVITEKDFSNLKSNSHFLIDTKHAR